MYFKIVNNLSTLLLVILLNIVVKEITILLVILKFLSQRVCLLCKVLVLVVINWQTTTPQTVELPDCCAL